MRRLKSALKRMTPIEFEPAYWARPARAETSSTGRECQRNPGASAPGLVGGYREQALTTSARGDRELNASGGGTPCADPRAFLLGMTVSSIATTLTARCASSSRSVA
jgi:hypothetical protein